MWERERVKDAGFARAVEAQGRWAPALRAGTNPLPSRVEAFIREFNPLYASPRLVQRLLAKFLGRPSASYSQAPYPPLGDAGGVGPIAALCFGVRQLRVHQVRVAAFRLACLALGPTAPVTAALRAAGRCRATLPVATLRHSVASFAKGIPNGILECGGLPPLWPQPLAAGPFT